MNTNIYTANGKLLLTAEYFVLDGAKALALPTKFGQTLKVEESKNEFLNWISIDYQNNIWLEVSFDKNLKIINTSDVILAQTLQNILIFCNLKNSNLQFTTYLNFDRNWGLGSSSTLISLLAQFANINPYLLLQNSFGGSGYDIACAISNNPIFYEIKNKDILHPSVELTNFNPTFKENLYFVYLGKKQNSRDGIQYYKNLCIDKFEIIEQLNDVTHKLKNAVALDDFCYYIELHEHLIAATLQLKKVKDFYFHDFPGSIKSLGAWGGDFILVASDEEEKNIRKYFSDKNLNTFFKYDEIILGSPTY